VHELAPFGALGEAQLARARDELVEIRRVGGGERRRRREQGGEKKPCGEPQGFFDVVLDR